MSATFPSQHIHGEGQRGSYISWAFPFSLTDSPLLSRLLTEHTLHSGPGVKQQLLQE